MIYSSFAALIASAALFTGANAEQHTVTFINNCGFGTPILEANGQTLSTGQSVTFNGPLISAIAFLQTGGCGDNGEGCTVVEFSLAGNESVVEIIVAPPYGFSVPVSVAYLDGCDGVGIDCNTAGCAPPPPFGNMPGLEVDCNAENVNLGITFCD